MKQIGYSKYGDAEQLKLINVPKPAITGKNQLLVKVLYSSLNAIDWKNRKGEFRLVSGLFGPTTKQGFDVVGYIVDKSSDVKSYNINDKIIGELGNLQGGALSEFVILKPNQLTIAPNNIPDEQLGGLSMAGTTAWQAFFKNTKIKMGDKILINGGSSGVGHLAIQIAKAYGAFVTSVSSTKNLDFCKLLGADKTIDYTQQDFTMQTEKYDVIFDVVFNSSLKNVKKILKPNGVYIGTTPTVRLLYDAITGKQAKFVSVNPNSEALKDLVRLIENKQLYVHIDKIFGMEEIVEAHKYIEKSRTRGKLIIKIAD